MKMSKLILLAVLMFIGYYSEAQDLISKIPRDARVVMTFNNKAFLSHLSSNDLNTTLHKLGFFDKVFKNENSDSYTIEDLGIDFNNKAYLYGRGVDSVQYVSALFPLANKNQFESIVSKDNNIEYVDNLPTIYSEDRTFRVSWDENTIYMITGFSQGSYFDSPAIKKRYGLVSAYGESYEDYDPNAVDSAWTAWEPDTVSAVEWDEEEVEIIDTAITFDEYEEEVENYEEGFEDYDMVDSVLAQEEYSDDYYSEYDYYNKYNDSIKNNLIAEWLNVEFNRVISGYYGTYNATKLKGLNNTTLIDIRVDSLDILLNPFYSSLLTEGFGSSDYLVGGFGLNSNKLPNLGYKSFDAQLNVKGNTLELSTKLGLSKEIVKDYKNILKKGVNPKFYRFLDENVLGFFAINVNTEAYLKAIPSFMDRNYSFLLSSYSDVISLSGTMLATFMDEKAIAKVYKGDNLLIVNGVTNTEVQYTDYEYDDNYDYIEIQKTKTEVIPQFLWMFSSEDTKIFNKMISVGLNHNVLKDVENGIYLINETGNSSFQVYVQIKNGIVFIGNDMAQMRSISQNYFSSKPSSAYVSLVKKNVASFVYNTKLTPSLLEELEIPVKANNKEFVDGLSSYGDFKFYTPGIVKDNYIMKSTLEFPKNTSNAVQYLFDALTKGVE